jgi:hypothetical protein
MQHVSVLRFVLCKNVRYEDAGGVTYKMKFNVSYSIGHGCIALRYSSKPYNSLVDDARVYNVVLRVQEVLNLSQ